MSHGQLLEAVRHQIDYYFSIDNLVKDLFLRRKMDDGGWIPTAVGPFSNASRVWRAAVAAAEHCTVAPLAGFAGWAIHDCAFGPHCFSLIAHG